MLNYSKSALWDSFLGTQERVQNSFGKQAISVRAIEILLYYFITYLSVIHHLDCLSSVHLIQKEGSMFWQFQYLYHYP